MRHRTRGWPLLLLAAAAAAALGCVGRHLLFATHTRTGVAIAATGEVPTEFTFGYDRYEGALIQLEEPRAPWARGERPPLSKELPHLYACITLQNGWLDGVGIAQVFATGEAAQSVAKSGGKACPKEIIPGKTTVEKSGAEGGAQGRR